MCSITQVSTNMQVDTAERERDLALQEVQRLNRRIAELELEVKELRPYKAKCEYRKQLDRVPQVSTMKDTFDQCREVFDTRKPDEEGFYHVVFEYMAKPKGTSKATISRQIDVLDKAGIIEKEIESVGEGKEKRNHVRIRPLNFTLEALEKANTNYGGKRVPLHRECGGECTAHTHILYNCTKCGEVGITKKNILMVDEEKVQRWEEERSNIIEFPQPVDAPEEVEIDEDEEYDFPDEEYTGNITPLYPVPQVKLNYKEPVDSDVFGSRRT